MNLIHVLHPYKDQRNSHSLSSQSYRHHKPTNPRNHLTPKKTHSLFSRKYEQDASKISPLGLYFESISVVPLLLPHDQNWICSSSFTMRGVFSNSIINSLCCWVGSFNINNRNETKIRTWSRKQNQVKEVEEEESNSNSSGRRSSVFFFLWIQ